MRNLFRFILNNQFILLFFLLEIISISLIVRNNNYHKSKYLVFSQHMSGIVSQKRNNLVQYLSLKEINQQLASENLRLKNQVESYNLISGKSKAISDTAINKHYQYISARVVNNSVNKQFNYLTINKGTEDGIEQEMAVIAPDGVVGIVESVSKHYALVISLLNRNLKVSAKIKKNNYFGSFEWTGKSYRQAILNEIPLHVDIVKGDTIVTSGFSEMFPEGIPLATIEDFSINSGTFFSIDLLITTDFRRLNYVYVIKNYIKTEQLMIEKTVFND
jgi:rod shape-determining protein MreC